MTHAMGRPLPLHRRAVLAAAASLPFAASAAGAERGRDHLAYVAGDGISVWRVNSRDGAMVQAGLFAVEAPTALALDGARGVLYVASASKPDGTVAAYAIERDTGVLAPLNAVSSRGIAPGHVSLHPSGKFALVANLEGGIAVLPIDATGALGAASDVQAADGARMAMAAADPEGRFIVASDAGRDRILRFTLDLATGRLAAASEPVASLSGAAPGRFAFRPDGRVLYVLQQGDGMVVAYDYAPETAAMQARQRLPALPPDYAGAFRAVDLALSPDGRFLYVVLAGHDVLAVFLVGGDGRLTRIGEAWTEGEEPAGFAFAPDGTMLFACNRRSGAITSFRVNRLSGALDFVGRYTAVAAPVGILFLG